MFTLKVFGMSPHNSEWVEVARIESHETFTKADERRAVDYVMVALKNEPGDVIRVGNRYLVVRSQWAGFKIETSQC